MKSDDTVVRAKVYEAIVRGDDTFERSRRLQRARQEMRSLGLNVELIEEGGQEAKEETPVAAE